MPAVSVVIPTLRGGHLLREAVASIRAQSLSDWELIIVSDGCDDDLSDIERDEPRVRILRQRNRGVAIARNVGISHARSELLAFLDDDDLMLPDRLQTQFDAMADLSIGLCHTQFRCIDHAGVIIGAGGSQETQYRDFLLERGSVLISTSMVRRNLIDEIGGFSPVAPSEDVDFLYRAAREGTFLFLPQVLTEYRRHESNVSATMLGGPERRLILMQHLFTAQVRGEVDNVRSIRKGLAYVPSERAARAMSDAYAALSQRHFVKLGWSMATALILAPRFAIRVMTTKKRNDFAAKRPVSSTTD